MDELWKDVPGYEGVYQASNIGRVRSIDRVGDTCYGATRKLKGRILAMDGGKRGYRRVSSGKYGNIFAHRMVALAWVPNPENLPFINHLDGNKGNNHPSNLEWCTHLDNMRHAYRTGLAKVCRLGRGDLSIASKLTEAQVANIKLRLLGGERVVDLAKEHRVSGSTISELKAGRSWGHVNAAHSV